MTPGPGGSGAAVHDAEDPSDLRTCRFGPVDITYDGRVLEPRPWTLAQSEWAAKLAVDLRPGPLLELCSGAGHIGLAAAVLADRPLVQVDASEPAVAQARANAAAAGVADRVEVRHGRLEEAVGADERFPLVLADPPYLPRRDVGLFPEDPVSAIDGGDDGLDLVRACLVVAARHLDPGGHLLLQVRGPAQVAEVGALLPGTAPDLELVDHLAVDDQRAVAHLRSGAPPRR